MVRPSVREDNPRALAHEPILRYHSKLTTFLHPGFGYRIYNSQPELRFLFVFLFPALVHKSLLSGSGNCISMFYSYKTCNLVSDNGDKQLYRAPWCGEIQLSEISVCFF